MMWLNNFSLNLLHLCVWPNKFDLDLPCKNCSRFNSHFQDPSAIHPILCIQQDFWSDIVENNVGISNYHVKKGCFFHSQFFLFTNSNNQSQSSPLTLPRTNKDFHQSEIEWNDLPNKFVVPKNPITIFCFQHNLKLSISPT